MDENQQSNEGKFLPLLGKLVLTVADVEGAAGELVVLRSDRTVLSRAWAQSGQQLIRELRKCFDAANFQVMCDDMDKLLPQRNLLMHGEWLFSHADTDTALVLKRKHLKGDLPTPQFDQAYVSVGHMERLVAAYENVFKGLSGYIGDAMGLTPTRSAIRRSHGDG